ncbi:MAG: glutathione S-transferase family protein [Solirubrobacterales bacterium]
MSKGSGLPVLHQITYSHFNEKARWALDYKGVAHRRRTISAGPHMLRSRRLGGTGTLPVLVIDGEAVTDSSEIIAELERRFPDPPLYPADESDRRRALELEAQLGAELGPAVRAALFQELLQEPSIAEPMLYQELPRASRIAHRFTFPLERIAMRRALGADDAGGREGRRKTVEAMDLVEAELGSSNYLVGDRFSIADLTAAALFTPLVAPPEFPYLQPDPWPSGWEDFRSELRGRRAWQYAEEMYRRHRGASAEVD